MDAPAILIGVPIGRVVGAEVLTGVMVGLFLAGVTVPCAWWTFGSWEIALVVGLSLLAACGVATVVAMTLPWLIGRLGGDPAFGSGPLATVVQDLLSLLIYFGIADLILS